MQPSISIKVYIEMRYYSEDAVISASPDEICMHDIYVRLYFHYCFFASPQMRRAFLLVNSNRSLGLASVSEGFNRA